MHSISVSARKDIMEKTRLQKYAHALLTTGVNLQKDQTLVINVDVENQDFALIVTQEAYALGANEVVLNWRSTTIGKERLLHAADEVLANPAPWIPEYYKTYVDKGAAFLSLISANPKALAGVPSERIASQSRNLNKVLHFYHEAIMDSTLTWCVASVATLRWAELLGFTGTNEEKIDALWSEIFTLCRIENVSADEELASHLKRLATRTKAMNDYHFQSLHYTCTNGTDLTIALPKNHLWQGGAEASKKGVIFDANIPTEEVFTAPQYDGVNGIVYSTKPLIYQGNEINDFHFTFENGKIVDYDAKVGKEHLKHLLETDEGSAYLGEVALVDHYSPISQSNRIYFETLFDENASCHLAIGAAYPTCLANSDGLSKEELKKEGLNYSLTHVDFMVGHEDMNIEGITATGEVVTIMKKGQLLI